MLAGWLVVVVVGLSPPVSALARPAGAALVFIQFSKASSAGSHWQCQQCAGPDRARPSELQVIDPSPTRPAWPELADSPAPLWGWGGRGGRICSAVKHLTSSPPLQSATALW